MPEQKYSRKDFASDREVRWCPGCGDYAILTQVQKVMPQICDELQLAREKITFVSGIGCSSRFPYYMNTYGFHTIHGRAPAIATGLQVSRPDLQIWVVTGDGDGLSIGTNHLVHCLRRNVDLKILLFNNRIYGLTKGQYSPTSRQGKRTKSSPMGTIEQPINPISVAVASEATFVARTVATDTTHLQEVLLRAAHHRGTAFVEIMQNCNVFNDGAFDSFSTRAVRADRSLYIRHGQPMIFGKNNDRALRMPSGNPEIVDLAKFPKNKLRPYDETSERSSTANVLAHLNEDQFPVPLGVLRCIKKPTYSELLDDQIQTAEKRRGKKDFMTHVHSGEIWTIDG